MTFIIVGASAGLGRALAEKFASEKHDLILISSDMRDLKPLQMDLENRFNVKSIPIEMSLTNSSIDFKEILQSLEELSSLEGLLFPIGYSYENDHPGLENEKMLEIFNVNLISICVFVNYFLDELKKKKSIIIGFGSVAAIRGRSKNATYAAAKRGLESFFESLRHYTQDSQMTSQFYSLGYLDTTQAFNDEQKIIFKRADVKKLAEIVYSNLYKDFGTAFYPKTWKMVKTILPIIPWSIFKKMKV